MPWRHKPSRFELVDIVPGSPGSVGVPVPEHRPLLRRVAAEALIIQDEVQELLVAIRARQNLGVIAPRGGPLVRRLFELRDALPERCEGSDDETVRGQLSVILHYDAMALSTAMELLANEWRSERLRQQVDRLGGLGEPAVLLEQLYHRLSRTSPTVPEARSA